MICFVTSIFGDNINQVDKPAKFKKNPKYDYILFTNLAEDSFDTSWTVVNINNFIQKFNLKRNVTKSRYAKFMITDYFRQQGLDYDMVVYCDGIYVPNVDFDWTKFQTKLKDIKGLKLAQYTHKNNFVSELKLIQKIGKDSATNCAKTLQYFKKNYGRHISAPIFTNTFLIYEPKCPIFQKLTQQFWDIYSTEELTFRDQPLWAILLQSNGYKPSIIKTPAKRIFKKTGKRGFNGHKYAKK